MTEYTARERRQITRHALHRLAMASEAEASAETRDIARAELQRLYRQDDKPDLREPYVARFTVQPGVHLTVDASHNIVLEVRTPDEAELLAAYPLSDVVRLADRAANARSIVRIADEQGPEVARVVARDWTGIG